jgi:hypothetical protein
VQKTAFAPDLPSANKVAGERRNAPAGYLRGSFIAKMSWHILTVTAFIILILLCVKIVKDLSKPIVDEDLEELLEYFSKWR